MSIESMSKHDLAMMEAEAQCPFSVEDVDLFAPGGQEYWFDAYRILHRDAPVLRIPGGGDTPDKDGFILTKYEDVARIVRDTETFPLRYSDESPGQEVERNIIRGEGFGESLDAGMSLRPTMEQHRWHREQLTNPWVGAVGADRNREMITDFVNELIDRWIDRGEVEYVTEFAAPLPQMVITTILGFPLEDMPTLRKWEEAQVRRFVFGSTHRNLLPAEDEAENARALVAFHEYIQKQVVEKRRNPKNDMISYLTQVEYGDEKRPLTDAEVGSVAYGMHIGGNETTQYALTAEAMVLAQQPELAEELRADRSKVRFFVEECAAPVRAHAGSLGAAAEPRHRGAGRDHPEGVGHPPPLRGGEPRRGGVPERRGDRPDPSEPGPPRHVRPGAALLSGSGTLAAGAEHRDERDARPAGRPPARSGEEQPSAPARGDAGSARAEPGVQQAVGRPPPAGPSFGEPVPDRGTIGAPGA